MEFTRGKNDAKTKTYKIVTRGIDSYTHNRDERLKVITKILSATGYEHAGETAEIGETAENRKTGDPALGEGYTARGKRRNRSLGNGYSRKEIAGAGANCDGVPVEHSATL